MFPFYFTCLLLAGFVVFQWFFINPYFLYINSKLKYGKLAFHLAKQHICGDSSVFQYEVSLFKLQKGFLHSVL